jgi:O-antigen/teichoic acid export membrane protein
MTSIFTVIVALAIPLIGLAYGQWKIVAPALVMLLACPAVVLQTPVWVHYRSMEFAKQRTLQAIDPVLGFVVMVALAVAGFGYWALVAGTLLGSYAAAAAAVKASPYKLRFRYERGSLNEYVSFSWPLLAQSATAVLAAQVAILVAQRSLGTAAVGAIALASSLTVYANQVDDIVVHAIYPAVCAVKDRTDLLFETFTKSNRMALLWAVPIGTGLALFAGDLVHYVIGDKWQFAVFLIQVLAVTTALYQIGFNWGVFYRARGETRPIAIVGVVALVTTCAIVVPLTISDGLHGYAIGTAIGAGVAVVLRSWYLSRLFPAFRVLTHSARAIAPTLPALAAVLLMRAAEPSRSATSVIVEAVVFVAVTAAGTLLSERALVREFFAYFRRRNAPAIGASAG